MIYLENIMTLTARDATMSNCSGEPCFDNRNKLIPSCHIVRIHVVLSRFLRLAAEGRRGCGAIAGCVVPESLAHICDTLPSVRLNEVK